ncbi:aspartyl protease family protein [Kordia sp. YSTF-M3]|uniref:Aspartyl protease family protein n=1 Tax=Kordia aestuariivivens TaxID=2759037 RepID=A0ABR7Q3W6_9FLAO|nr:aspartyl protease family protein [Kordia aestuariivivens]MBC8753254.1 aspartyl protease family protein [Kordia aestuariivivens]
MKIHLKYHCVLFVSYLLGFTAALQAQVATIPFESDGLMYIKVKVNDHAEPLNFVFDTGASTAVLDEKVAKEIGITADYQQPAAGAAGTEMYNIALSQKLHIQDITLADAHVVLVDLDRLSKRGNQRIDGIIGYNIMQHYVTHIDYDQQEIKLYKNVDDIAAVDAYKMLPVSLGYASIPQVELEFTLKNNKKFKGSFLFDSGANMTFLLNTPFVKANNIETLIGKTIENKAESLTTSSSFKIGNVTNVQLGDFKFGEMPIDLSNSTSGVMASEAYAGILGVKIIQRFHIILDYKNQKIYLKPNKSYANEFEFPRSGISIEKEADKIKISNVVKVSEAYQKGIREGDQLLEIDEVVVNDTRKCRELLKQKDTSVKLKLKDEKGEVKTVIIFLKRLI